MGARRQRRELERSLNKVSDETLLYRIKYQINSVQSQRLIDKLSPQRRKAILGNSLPKEYSEIGKGIKTYHDDKIEDEIIWLIKSINQYHVEINSFLILENRFEHHFLKGEYANAKNILNTIEENICVSLWSIEKRLLIAEFETGFKKNKDELTRVLGQNNELIIEIISKYLSIRVEKNLSIFKYEEIINSYINYYDGNLKNYLTYKLNFFSKYTYNNKAFLLSYESSFSIIDRYNSFITVILMITSELDGNYKLRDFISESINQILPKINDVRLTNILYSLGKNTPFSLTDDNKEYLRLLDLYTKGDYKMVINDLKHYLSEHANYFELYDLLNKVVVNLNLPFENIFSPESFAGQCLQNTYDILNKTAKTQQSLMQAHKAFNLLGLCSWSYKYFAYVNNEYSNDTNLVDMNKFSHLNTNYFNPVVSIYFDKNKQSFLFLDTLQCLIPDNSTIEFWKIICSNLYNLEYNANKNDIYLFRSEIYKYRSWQSKEKYEQALNGYISLQNDVRFVQETILPYYREEITYGIISCLIKLNQFEKAIDLVVKSNLSNSNLIARFRFPELLNKINRFDDENLMKNISSSILLHQNQHLVNPNDIWVSYDNFLMGYELLFPREIENIMPNLDLKKVIYFLKNICKQEIFNSSCEFENQDDLDNERIEICSILTRLDAANFEEYIKEISEISRNILIRKGIKQIDESKIYVDVKGVKKSLEKDLRESFERSTNLRSLPIDQLRKLDLNADSIYIAYFGKSSETNRIEPEKANIKFTNYSRVQEFVGMFIKIRDKFIASNEFGLETYLSMRIRHGTLLGEIRSIFEKNHLITKKEDASDSYKENNYWLKTNIGNNSMLRNSFNLIMGDFSNKIDTISGHLKNNELQIKTEVKTSNGLFDYSFNEKTLQSIFIGRIADIENFDAFFDEIVNILWERTENNLSNIRYQISQNIKGEMVDLLTKLSNDIDTLASKSKCPEIYEIIRSITSCQTDIKYELDKISEWFKRTNNKAINEFDISLPIDTTLTTLKRLFKDYNQLEPSINCNCNVKFEGEYFQHLSYIMQNLFHNIIQHSKLSCDELNVRITISQDLSILTLMIENNFANELNISDMNRQIEAIRQLLLLPHDNDKTRTEEGTGYLKIKKTLKSDLGIDDAKIDILNVDEYRIFKTIITFNIDTLQKN